MYLNTDTSAYPISESEIRSSHPNTSFPQPFTPPDGYAWVFPAPKPAFDSVINYAREIAPVLTDKGHWQQVWEVVSRFTEYTDEAGMVHTVEAQQAAAQLADQVQKDLQLQKTIEANTQIRLDTFAQTRGYDDIKSASSYAGCSVSRFDVEGTYCRNIRAETWNTLYNILDQVKAGNMTKPINFSDIEPLLPVLEWPLV